MTPTHHLPADWIVGYAAGTLHPGEQVCAATHLTFCPACREQVRLAEVVGARALTEASSLALDPHGLDAVLAKLDAPEPPAEPAFDPSGLLPAPIFQLTGPAAKLKWRWLAPFIQGVDLPVPTKGLPLRLVRMSAGASLPHRHAGLEVGVILQGGWTDQYGHVGRGDFAAVDDEEAVHHQRIDRGEPCIALVLNAAPGIPANPLVALVGRYLFAI